MIRQSQRAERRLKALIKSIEEFEDKLKKLDYGSSQKEMDEANANKKYYKNAIQSEEEAIAMIIRNLI